MPTSKNFTKLISSGAVTLSLALAIAGSVAYSPSATAAPNSVKADLKVVSIGSAVPNETYRCPIDNGPSLTYRVAYKHMGDDQAYMARVSFTTGSNQALSVSYVGADFTPSSAPVCYVWTAPNGWDRVGYCDIESWNSGGTMTFDFTVTTGSDDLNVSATVFNLRSEADGQGKSLAADNYLEHAYNPAC